MANVQEILDRLKESNCEPDLLRDVQQALEGAAMEETEGRIIRTNKGALMVRLSPTRWPIGMYAKDWRILISLVKSGAIEHALKTMNIMEDNPQKSPRQERQLEAVAAARSSQVRDRSQLLEEEEQEEEEEPRPRRRTA